MKKMIVATEALRYICPVVKMHSFHLKTVAVVIALILMKERISGILQIICQCSFVMVIM